MTRGKPLLVAAATTLLVAGCSLPFSDHEGQGAASTTGADGRATAVPSTGDEGDDKKPVSVTVTGTGDILVHVPVTRSAKSFAQESGSQDEFDFDPMFAGVKPALSGADVSICHQETPISATNDDLSKPGSLVYNVPREIAPALKTAGFDGCDTASNHVWDRGAKGIDTTREQLTKAGLKVAGPTTDPADPGMPAVYEAKGVKVANLSYTYTILNQSGPNTNTPPGADHLGRYLYPKIGAAGIIADAKKVKEAGADLVVVSVHWGSEYVKEPTKEQQSIAKQLLASPYVDGIFGAHAHLIQPCQTFGGKTVFYGLGNFLSNQGPGTVGTLDENNADGAIAKYTFTRGEDGTWSQKASYQPTMVDVKGKHKITLSTPESNPGSFNRTKSAMNELGSCSATADGG
ncbi:poly-gamma-glutamate synthesis protein (capsule biosynthesis protein) [Barrientosiimonas humi]|uniref:Poly-gamma-glutamate synthesis protein (Capsule biosynthesis protein) n=1 Tax=Barrientosiimonas humi TaxID=999931 RepID=A0A542XCX0_9MICO|nr:CapA family protein [Barrientosiimonas humi]TQL33655.1 poly-gamma-glutamate synthesis protein (capsule biosynthesis protein) [Barrientosiimonas humi]CAG7573642.1 Capsule biosynthesis protein CapA [Barrientosiimonas humi]